MFMLYIKGIGYNCIFFTKKGKYNGKIPNNLLLELTSDNGIEHEEEGNFNLGNLCH